VVHALPSAQSALAVQHPGNEVWVQVPVAVLQASVVQAEVSAQSAFFVQQPVIGVCWQV